jgi:hypothetical protein
VTRLSTVSVAIAAAVAALFCLSRLRQEPAGTVRDQLHQIHSELKIQRRAIDDCRSVLNDAHKLIHTVSKGLAKQPS